MFDPEENKPVNENPQGEETDRVDGEYHFRNGYSQRVYSDAHYVREATIHLPRERPGQSGARKPARAWASGP